jgi:hypothetical protein
MWKFLGGLFSVLPVKSAKQQKLSSSNYFWKKMENKDSSIFSDHGKAIFSGNQTSEVSMGNPNTAEEKKSQIETKKQEIKENQEVNMKCNSNIEPNLVGNGIGGEIGEIGKNEAIVSTQEMEIQGNGETLKDVPLQLNESTISQNSGLDDSGSVNYGKGKTATTAISNKSGTKIGIQSTGIPKFNLQNQGKKIDSSRENLRKISPSTRHSMGSTVSSAITLGKGIEGLEIPIPNQTLELNPERKKSIPPINPRNPQSGKYMSKTSLSSEQQVKWNESQAKGDKNPYLGPTNMKQVDIDIAAQRLVERVKLASSLVASGGSIPLELQTPPTKARWFRALILDLNPR